MIKTILSILLIAPFLFVSSCKKDDKAANKPTFTISGIQDTTVEINGKTQFLLAVQQITGTAEPVTISVSGLPTGITATISPDSGTPTFSTSVSFEAAIGTIGTYPIKITGTSASYTISYDMTLTVLEGNGFYFRDIFYSADIITESFDGYFYNVKVSSDQSDAATLFVANKSAFPSADGTYTYGLYGPSNPNGIRVAVLPKNLTTAFLIQDDYFGKDFIFTRKNGKIEIIIPEITLYKGPKANMDSGNCRADIYEK